MRHSFWFLFAAAFAVLLGGCGGDSADSNEADVIKIGHYASLQGPEATFGQQVENGVRLAVEEINSSGGVLGKKIDLITEDTQSKVPDAKNAVQKLIAKNEVVALLGEVASSRSLAAAPIADREKVPMVTPASTNEKVTLDENGNPRPYVFRICFIDPFQGSVMAKFARENLGVTKAAILKDIKNDYSVGLAESFRKKFLELGGQIVEEQAYESGQSDFKAQLTAINARGPEVVFVPGYYTEVSLIAQQARNVGLTVPLLGGDGWDSPRLTEGEAGQALEGCYFSNHYSVEDTSATVKSFTDKYQAKYKELPGAMSALGYDAMYIIADVIKKKGKADSQSIRDGLEEVSNYPGVTGNITINDQHNAEKPAVVLQIKDGRFTYYSTVKP